MSGIISSGDLVRVAVVAEPSWGGSVSALPMQLINVKTPDLKRPRTPGKPDVIRGDRRRFATRILDESGAPVLSTLSQYGNTAMFWEGLQNQTWGSVVTLTGTTISFGAHTILDSGNGLATFLVGYWVYVAGAADASNNGWLGPISISAAGSLTVPQTLTVRSAGPSITIDTCALIDSSILKSYAIEENFSDLTTAFRSGAGNRVGQLAKNWNVSQFVDETWTFVGDVQSNKTATLGNGSFTAARTSDFMTTLDTDFTMLYENGVISPLIVSSLGLQYNNNTALIKGIGRGKGPAGVSVHSADIDVTLAFYYDASGVDFCNRAEAYTSTSLAWSEKDPQGNSMLYFLPSLKPEEGAPDPPAAGKDGMAKGKVTAFADPVFNYQMAIFRHAGP